MKSDPVRWHRLKDILVEALKETSFEKRTATLRESCGDDAELLGEAEKLLAHDATAFEYFREKPCPICRRGTDYGSAAARADSSYES
jgi:hypothetical protein